MSADRTDCETSRNDCHATRPIASAPGPVRAIGGITWSADHAILISRAPIQRGTNPAEPMLVTRRENEPCLIPGNPFPARTFPDHRRKDRSRSTSRNRTGCPTKLRARIRMRRDSRHCRPWQRRRGRYRPTRNRRCRQVRGPSRVPIRHPYRRDDATLRQLACKNPLRRAEAGSAS